MGLSGKRGPGQKALEDQDVREQEVLRANRELAAYFKGRRTEREARSAIKIIKAFIRDRERIPAAHRRPLPGSPSRSARTSGGSPPHSRPRADTKTRRAPRTHDTHPRVVIAADAHPSAADAPAEPSSEE
jgi:hypothetical protein